MNSAPAQEDKPHGQWNCWVNGTKCAKNHLKWRWFITLSGVHCVWAWGTRLEEALVIPAWWCLYPKYHPHGALRVWGSITFRKTSLSCNPDCISLEKKHAYTIRKWSLQLFSNTSDKGDSSFPVVAETLKLWVERAWGVSTHSSVQLCFSLQNWTAHHYPHLWKHTDSLFDLRMTWAVEISLLPTLILNVLDEAEESVL